VLLLAAAAAAVSALYHDAKQEGKLDQVADELRSFQDAFDNDADIQSELTVRGSATAVAGSVAPLLLRLSRLSRLPSCRVVSV
jgi:hypothetical protein